MSLYFKQDTSHVPYLKSRNQTREESRRKNTRNTKLKTVKHTDALPNILPQKDFYTTS